MEGIYRRERTIDYARLPCKVRGKRIKKYALTNVRQLYSIQRQGKEFMSKRSENLNLLPMGLLFHWYIYDHKFSHDMICVRKGIGYVPVFMK